VLSFQYTSFDGSSTVQTLTLPTATCSLLGTNSIAQATAAIQAKANTAIQYKVTLSNSPTYVVRAAVYQEGQN